MLLSWASSGSPSDPPSALTSGMIAVASCLPSSTPHWSNELMFQIVALREHLVLVDRDELPERVRREAFGEDRVGRVVAGERAARTWLGTPRRDLARVLPKASASVCASKLAMSRSWCVPTSWLACTNPMKSAGISFVPWWISW